MCVVFKGGNQVPVLLLFITLKGKSVTINHSPHLAHKRGEECLQAENVHKALAVTGTVVSS